MEHEPFISKSDATSPEKTPMVFSLTFAKYDMRNNKQIMSSP